MPFTPFIGLSILIHIALIIIYKSFQLRPAGSRRVQVSVFARLWFGLLIITIVFSTVMASALVLIHASVVEKHSTINFVTNNGQAIIDTLYQGAILIDSLNLDKIIAISPLQ